MELNSGWLGRSLEQARKNVMARPEYLRPEKYRTKSKSDLQTKKKRPSDKS